jgi:GTP-binding protein EngB required for normal cell division
MIFYLSSAFRIAFEAMKTEEKNSSPKVRIAVLGNMNVGKSGK